VKRQFGLPMLFGLGLLLLAIACSSGTTPAPQAPTAIPVNQVVPTSISTPTLIPTIISEAIPTSTPMLTFTPAPIEVSLDNFVPSELATQAKLWGATPLSVDITNDGSESINVCVAVSLEKPNGDAVNIHPLALVSLGVGERETVSWSHDVDLLGYWDVIFGVWEFCEEGKELKGNSKSFLSDTCLCTPSTLP